MFFIYNNILPYKAIIAVESEIFKGEEIDCAIHDEAAYQ